MKGIVPPPYEIPKEKAQRRNATYEVKTPLLISLFAWLCIFRAAVNIVFGLIVGLWPESGVAVYLATHFDPAPKLVSPEIVFYVLAVAYGLVGWRWYCRDWRARWVAMFMAGANVATTMVNLIADRASGVNTPMAPGQQSALVMLSAFNLLIFLYLAFYPGMEQAFKETPWA